MATKLSIALRKSSAMEGIMESSAELSELLGIDPITKSQKAKNPDLDHSILLEAVSDFLSRVLSAISSSDEGELEEGEQVEETEEEVEVVEVETSKEGDTPIVPMPVIVEVSESTPDIKAELMSKTKSELLATAGELGVAGVTKDNNKSEIVDKIILASSKV